MSDRGDEDQGIYGGIAWHRAEPAEAEPRKQAPPPRAAHTAVTGNVVAWHAQQGWGDLRTPDGLEVWCHFSDIEAEGYRVLAEGQTVTIDYETPGQDGFEARVRSFVRPAH